MVIYGIDPGFSGGWGAITPDGQYISCGDMFSENNLLSFKKILQAMMEVQDGESLVVVEAVHAMPRQGVSSSFKFGMAYGGALALAECLGTRYLAVPRVWKRDMGLDASKEASLTMARELWPKAPLHRRKDDGRAEALLMAEWKRRML